MIEYVLMNGNDEELWEVDYEKKIALNISELNIVIEKVVKYPGTIEDYKPYCKTFRLYQKQKEQTNPLGGIKNIILSLNK